MAHLHILGGGAGLRPRLGGYRLRQLSALSKVGLKEGSKHARWRFPQSIRRKQMFKSLQRLITALALFGAVAVGSAVIANAASNSSTSGQTTQSPQAQFVASSGNQGGARGPNETPLTGETAAKVKQAAEDKVPGGTVLRVETDSDGSPYEAHVRKSDGTEVVVKVNKDFEVTAVQQGGRGPGGRGPCHHRTSSGGSSSGSGASSSSGSSSSGQV
jgi:hypothetical protein